ncbi:hypothetical protein CHELA17_20037 [Chelatococcus asaccharovorans]|nr:hypothetical protein CHELA17_20037 [Chelatococcus asaccharovorans]
MPLRANPDWMDVLGHFQAKRAGREGGVIPEMAKPLSGIHERCRRKERSPRPTPEPYRFWIPGPRLRASRDDRLYVSK